MIEQDDLFQNDFYFIHSYMVMLLAKKEEREREKEKFIYDSQ
jgi:imidazoleglycerol phosphate synthase glutamine amidotransferase subunit HisH